MTTLAGTHRDVAPAREPAAPPSAYLRLLAVALVAYALAGKSFAYIGLGPIFVGEIVLFLGLLTMPVGSFVRVAAGGPGLLVLLWMYWCLWRTLPYLPSYGLDALRDAALWGYAALAFVVAANLARIGDPWPVLERWLCRFARLFPPCILALWLWDSSAPESVPTLSFVGTHLPLFLVKPGDVQVHLAASFLIGAFLERRHRLLVMATAALGILVFGTANRGGLVAAVMAVAVAGLLRPRRRAFWIAGGAVPVVTAAIALFTVLQPVTGALSPSSREISVAQLAENVRSIVSPDGSAGDLSGTRQWRLEWWTLIIEKSLYDRGGWLGRGFGLNLADADGFQVVDSDTQAPLRSPHNIHMTVLARAGIPGLVLWGAVIAGLLLGGYLGCRRHLAAGRHDAGLVLLVVTAYTLALLVNATFDVSIEGPMAGIWFWSLAGVLLAGLRCRPTPRPVEAAAGGG